MGTKETEKEDRLDRAYDARINRLSDVYSHALDSAVRISGSVTSNSLYRTSAEDRKVERAERKLTEARSALLVTGGVAEAARKWGLSGEERALLLRYVVGAQSSAQYDALTATLKAALDTFQAKQRELDAERARLLASVPQRTFGHGQTDRLV